MTAVVRQLRRTMPPKAQSTSEAPSANLTVESPSLPNGLGGDCLCGRGSTIGTCIVSSTPRLLFRAFYDGPAAFHLSRVTNWACVDCVADAAMDVASGVVRKHMEDQNG